MEKDFWKQIDFEDPWRSGLTSDQLWSLCEQRKKRDLAIAQRLKSSLLPKPRGPHPEPPRKSFRQRTPRIQNLSPTLWKEKDD